MDECWLAEEVAMMGQDGRPSLLSREVVVCMFSSSSYPPLSPSTSLSLALSFSLSLSFSRSFSFLLSLSFFLFLALPPFTSLPLFLLLPCSNTICPCTIGGSLHYHFSLYHALPLILVWHHSQLSFASAVLIVNWFYSSPESDTFFSYHAVSYAAAISL